jgi:ubiquinone biosynthesis protein
LAHTLGHLRGAFAKAGQFLALRHDWFEPEAREAFAKLRDGVQPVPWPAASAALPSDLFLLRLLVMLIARLRGRDVTRARAVFREYSEAIRRELDFEREAESAQAIAKNLAQMPNVEVPRSFPELSGRRLLTTADQAVIPCRGEVLRRRGIPGDRVLEVVVEAYAKQIFIDGLFHADPHSGNLFVLDRPDASRRPRVLFVDFGLTQQLSEAMADTLRRSFFALLQGDPKALLVAMQELGMVDASALGDVERAVDEMFRRLKNAGGEGLALRGEQVEGLGREAKRLLSETPGLTLPTELLLYAKTLAHLFELGRSLAPESDVMKLCVPYLVRFLGSRSRSGPGPKAGR